MADQQTGTLTNLYLDRYAYCDPLILSPPHPDLDLIVTIPCYNEPGLLESLQSLYRCDRKNICIEVIVVINQSAVAPASVTKQNQATLREATAWADRHSTPLFKMHILIQSELPYKHAGVGLARKIAMDEAVRRFEILNKPRGVIICFDADSSCDPNYFQAVHAFFRQHPKSPGCSIHFEHPLSGDFDMEVYDAIVDYELFLRYYVNALRYAGFPYAYETIGSSMAVRADAYHKQGGMNRRKAGEDFYFLHKIIPLGNYGEVNDTRVVPSPRKSDRVPFGTGKAVSDWLENRMLLTYGPDTFVDLKLFLANIHQLFRIDPICIQPWMETLPESVREFLKINDFTAQVIRINKHSTSYTTFVRQFYHWFDGFKVLKYVHFTRDHFYPNIPVRDAAVKLFRMLNKPVSRDISSKALLMIYRSHDRSFEGASGVSC